MKKLATRSGPGTRFGDTGSFDVRGETVKILCRAYNHNDVCWVECEVRPYKAAERVCITNSPPVPQ